MSCSLVFIDLSNHACVSCTHTCEFLSLLKPFLTSLRFVLCLAFRKCTLTQSPFLAPFLSVLSFQQSLLCLVHRATTLDFSDRLYSTNKANRQSLVHKSTTSPSLTLEFFTTFTYPHRLLKLYTAIHSTIQSPRFSRNPSQRSGVKIAIGMDSVVNPIALILGGLAVVVVGSIIMVCWLRRINRAGDHEERRWPC